MAQFTNQAQLSYQNVTVNSNIAVGEINELLEIYKTATPQSYSAGDSVTFVLNLVNSDAVDYPGLVVTDNLGAYTVGTNTVYPLTYETNSALFFVDGARQTGTVTVEGGPPLIFAGIDVPAGSTFTVVYRATVNSTAPLATGSTVVNQAEISGGRAIGQEDEAAITVNAAPDLTVNKSIDPVPVSESGTLTYTFNIDNLGNTAAVASDNVTLTDTFNPILSGLTVTLNGTPLALTTGYTYDTSTGAFATVPGVITVPAATYAQDTATGVVTTVPGTAVLTVSGTV